MIMLKKLLLTSVALVFAAGAALAISGNQIGLQIIGGASYCGSNANSTMAVTCNLTVPAGPAVVTGNETVIANTNLPSGQNPQTALLTMAGLNALPYQYVANAAQATTTTVAATTGTLILDNSVGLTVYGIQFPPATSLIDGQQLAITASNTISGITNAACAGTTIGNGGTTITVSATAPFGFKYVYNAPLTKWFRVQ
jgi:hypothetical protein